VFSPGSVVVIRPHFFEPNPETAQDNSFQKSATELAATISQKAFTEVTNMVALLRNKGIKVHIFEDESHLTPDSVFPNNWLATLVSGEITTFPMYARNRRMERRDDITDFLKQHYQVCKLVDFSHFEKENCFLEGTGSMILDQQNKIAYAALSNRTDEGLFHKFCQLNHFEPVLFSASNDQGTPVYHTNVMMAVGQQFAVIGSALIKDPLERQCVISTLEKSGKEVIDIDELQVEKFCGNVLELTNNAQQQLLAMSGTAFSAFREDQLETLSKYVELLPIDVPTIELAGGSVRCMLAGAHLPASF